MLERIGARRPGRIEHVALGLGALGCACHLVAFGAWLAAGRSFPASAGQPFPPAAVIGLAGSAILGITCILALWVNDTDERVPLGARRRWLAALLVFNLYAAPVFFVTRAIRRRGGGGRRSGLGTSPA